MGHRAPISEAGIPWGEKLRRLRWAKGLSQSQLADEAGLSQTRISALECGAIPGLRDFAGLRQALDLDVSEAIEDALELWHSNRLQQ